MPGKKVLPRCSATKLKMQTLQGFCGEGWSLSSTSPRSGRKERNRVALRAYWAARRIAEEFVAASGGALD